jgi:hypothetical protein
LIFVFAKGSEASNELPTLEELAATLTKTKINDGKQDSPDGQF